MHPLQERLAQRYSTLAVDWPEFGEGARTQLDWTPDAYAAFLAFLLTSMIVGSRQRSWLPACICTVVLVNR